MFDEDLDQVVSQLGALQKQVDLLANIIKMQHVRIEALEGNKRQEVTLPLGQSPYPRDNRKKNTYSQYRGVTKDKHSNGKAWKAQITHKGKLHHLGSFHTEQEAAQAYDHYAKQHLTQFPQILNFPETIHPLRVDSLQSHRDPLQKQKAILELIELKGRIQRMDILDSLGISQGCTNKHLTILTKQGFIIRHGIGKGTRYTINKGDANDNTDNGDS